MRHFILYEILYIICYFLRNCLYETAWQQTTLMNTQTQSEVLLGNAWMMLSHPKTVNDYPNQKVWINSDVRMALAARHPAYASSVHGRCCYWVLHHVRVCFFFLLT